MNQAQETLWAILNHLGWKPSHLADAIRMADSSVTRFLGNPKTRRKPNYGGMHEETARKMVDVFADRQVPASLRAAFLSDLGFTDLAMLMGGADARPVPLGLARDQQHLVHLADLGVDLRGNLLQIVWDDCEWLVEKYALDASEEAKRLVAQTYLVWGVSFFEQGVYPPQEAITYLQKAKTLADTIGDVLLSEHVLWRMAEYWRKVGEVTGDAKYYDMAHSSLSALQHRTSSPLLHAISSAEQAKLALAQDQHSSFTAEIARARELVKDAKPDVWPPFMADHFHHLILDAELRGYVPTIDTFTTPTTLAKMEALCAQMNALPHPLSPNFATTRSITLAHAYLKAPRSELEDRQHGLLLWWDGLRFSRKAEYRKQERRAVKPMEHNRFRDGLPSNVRTPCLYCGGQRSTKDREDYLTYLCDQCERPTIFLA